MRIYRRLNTLILSYTSNLARNAFTFGALNVPELLICKHAKSVCRDKWIISKTFPRTMLDHLRSISPDWNDLVLKSVFAKTLLIRLNVFYTTHERIPDDDNWMCDKYLAKHFISLKHVIFLSLRSPLNKQKSRLNY